MFHNLLQNVDRAIGKIDTVDSIVSRVLQTIVPKTSARAGGCVDCPLSYTSGCFTPCVNGRCSADKFCRTCQIVCACYNCTSYQPCGRVTISC